MTKPMLIAKNRTATPFLLEQMGNRPGLGTGKSFTLQVVAEQFASIGAIGSQIGRQIIRGVLGSFSGGER